jgi:hypothetical protein
MARERRQRGYHASGRADPDWNHTNVHSEDVHARKRAEDDLARSASQYAAANRAATRQAHDLARQAKAGKAREKREARAKAKAVRAVLKVQRQTIRDVRRKKRQAARLARQQRRAARQAARAARRR